MREAVMGEGETGGVLSGTRVLSLAVNVPGPVAAARLHGMGAAVTRVEPPAGDPLALVSPEWYASLIAGQEVIMLDLKDPAGLAHLHERLHGSDLLLTATRPAALERLGLAWPTLHARHPRLCQVEIVGYPAPDENRAGHDLTYQAALGLVAPPGLPRTLVADLAAAERAVSAALGLLLARERGAGGGVARVALVDAARGFAEPLRHGLTAPGGVLGGGAPVYDLYPAAEGWVAVALLEPHFIGRFLQETGIDSLDPEALRALFRTRTAAEWETWAAERDLPLCAVM
jgi:alpha-methylacyl-CoA racemase